MPWRELEVKLQALKKVTTENDVSAVQKKVRELVPEYTFSGEIVDWIHAEEVSNH